MRLALLVFALLLVVLGDADMAVGGIALASRRALVSATTTDALVNELIKDVERPSIVNMWATSVTVTDTVGLSLDSTTIMAPGTCNVSAAALGMVDTARDQLLFNTYVGIGKLRMPWTVTTSGIYLLSVEPIIA